MYKVYVLVDPDNDSDIRYVGITKNSLNSRLNGHIHSCKLYPNNAKSIWIKNLISKGLRPNVFIVDVIDYDWEFWEQHYISLFRSWNFLLYNRHMGGKLPNSIGSKNHMYGIPKEKHPRYGQHLSEKAKVRIGLDSSRRNKGQNNPNYGSSCYKRWEQKFGKEEADNRMRDRIQKFKTTLLLKKENK